MIEIPDNIRGLIFDCDGTLVDSMPCHMDAWKFAVSSGNMPWDYEFFFSKKGMTEREIIQLYKEVYNLDLSCDDIVETKHNYFRNNISSLKLITPIADIAYKYKDKLPMAVASGGTKEIVTAELEATGIINLFDFILTADDNIKPKPAPDLFLSAARLMNIDPGLCHVFEDGDLGLKAAEEAGMFSSDIRLYI